MQFIIFLVSDLLGMDGITYDIYLFAVITDLFTFSAGRIMEIRKRRSKEKKEADVELTIEELEIVYKAMDLNEARRHSDVLHKVLKERA